MTPLTSMIPEYADDLDFENRLPFGQAPIMTNSVKRFHACMQFIMQSREQTGYATMGIVTGDAGLGKTIAIQTYLQDLKPRAYSGFPACVGIKVSPRSTAKALAKTLITTLNGERGGFNVYDMEGMATEAIRRNDLDLVLVDEGDWLNVESFELLRHIFDRTGCPIVVVGLPRILRVINRHEKFVSRIGLHMEFLPLTREEVVTTVLPALTLPLWHYDANNPTDRDMGAQLWQRVCPSFRKLRVVLQYASQIAGARGMEFITAEILAETLRLILIPQVPVLRQGPQRPQGTHTPPSVQSQQRSTSHSSPSSSSSSPPAPSLSPSPLGESARSFEFESEQRSPRA
ncbi:MAG: ATP-binding protein [Chloroflexi bacterium]|nr:ATP-binding protein [Chloroflexota bacterium]